MKRMLSLTAAAAVFAFAASPADAADRSRDRDLRLMSPGAVVAQLCLQAKRERGMTCTAQQRAEAEAAIAKLRQPRRAAS